MADYILNAFKDLTKGSPKYQSGLFKGVLVPVIDLMGHMTNTKSFKQHITSFAIFDQQCFQCFFLLLLIVLKTKENQFHCSLRIINCINNTNESDLT